MDPFGSFCPRGAETYSSRAFKASVPAFTRRARIHSSASVSLTWRSSSSSRGFVLSSVKLYRGVDSESSYSTVSVMVSAGHSRPRVVLMIFACRSPVLPSLPQAKSRLQH
ncbi:hypothetical protein Mapa_005186 [Marchantia paleacea]|nr:hypothetical protein Mapa_005186 [Marchantia paleacea]